jgi:hypothetical protein
MTAEYSFIPFMFLLSKITLPSNPLNHINPIQRIPSFPSAASRNAISVRKNPILLILSKKIPLIPSISHPTLEKSFQEN